MIKKLFSLTSIFLSSILLLFSFNANADFFSEPLDSFTSVDEAITEISDILENKSYEIVLVVDHAAGAESVGLTLRPTQVIFARPNPFLERRLIRRSSTIAIDLPIKVLAFEDENGEIQVRHNPIGYLIDRHDARVKDYLWRVLDKSYRHLPELDQGLITIDSQLSFDQTVTALQQAITSNPAFRIPLTLNIEDYRRDTQSTLIVFGNPNAGTPLMQATQEIGIDLPQKMLVWMNEYGQVHITYNDPKFLAKRHNIQGQEPRLTAISNALANFAQQGSGQN